MSSGNFLSGLGLDPQLISAGLGGGLLKALVWRQRVVDAISSMIAGAVAANWLGRPAASVLSSVEMLGIKVNIAPEVGGFFVGIFAFAIVELLAKLLRDKLKTGGDK